MDDTLNRRTLDRLKLPLALTLAGLWAERLTRAFWPLWTLLLAALSAMAFGLHETAPLEAVWAGMLVVLGGAVWALVAGIRTFRRPRLPDAVARLDGSLPGRPLAALADTLAVGRSDSASAAVWAVHRQRMAQKAADAKPVAPDLRLARRDPFGLRYVALTAFVMALLFGSLWRVASVTGLAPGAATAMATGPTWEGWIQPPPYTGKPALYLNDIDREGFEVPVGSRVQVRMYGEVGDLTLAETVSGRAGTDVPPASDPAQDFSVAKSGQIEISGPGGRVWQVMALPDGLPSVEPAGSATRERDGRMRLPFTARDDHGVTGGRAEITVDLSALPRRFGLEIGPEARDALVLDLPMPIRGNRTEFEEALLEDVSKHPWANMPVQVRLSVTDAANQTGTSEVLRLEMPGKRFFDPLAAAIIEMRRDLLWNRENAGRTVQIFKAITNHPQGFIRHERAWLHLRVLLRRLDAEKASLTPELRDEFADTLWDIALMVEEGDLASALERLQRAQDRLDEAIRNGADPAEIDRLMDEMREALDEYMRRLAEQAPPQDGEQGADEPGQGDRQAMEFSGNQLQEMLDELQRLMEEGKTAEAQELMEMMRQLMENMQVTQGQGGQGQGNPAMRDLGQALRDQQNLSDDAFRDLQEGDGQGQQGQNQPGQPGEGQEGEGQEGEGQGQGGGQSLAERQRELRDRLGGMDDSQLPGAGTDAGEAGRRALEDARRAMREAEDALRDGDLPGALDRQAEAMEAMREGMRELGEAMAEEQRQNGQPGQQGDQPGERFGRADPNATRDPLGREPGEGARLGSDQNLLQGEDMERRADELLGEIRRRQGELARPEAERDYLRRLLDMF